VNHSSAISEGSAPRLEYVRWLSRSPAPLGPHHFRRQHFRRQHGFIDAPCLDRSIDNCCAGTRALLLILQIPTRRCCNTVGELPACGWCGACNAPFRRICLLTCPGVCLRVRRFLAMPSALRHLSNGTWTMIRCHRQD
jgi:hypothetical protein